MRDIDRILEAAVGLPPSTGSYRHEAYGAGPVEPRGPWHRRVRERHVLRVGIEPYLLRGLRTACTRGLSAGGC